MTNAVEKRGHSWLPLFGLSLCLASLTGAEALLTPGEAVSIALKNNYSLALARDQRSEASVDRRTGIGPFLPGASANVGTSGSLTDSVTRVTTVGVNANWQIFDGFQSYNSYQRLKANEKAAGYQERLAMETTVESVLNAYYAVAAQKQILTALVELTGVAEDQARLANAKAQVGAGSKLDQLQAVATLNQDSSSLLSQEVSLRQSQVQLNQILARPAYTEFDVMDTIPLEPGLPLENWKTSLPENNAAILTASAQRNAVFSGLNQAKGLWLPSLSAGVGYSTTPSSLNSSGVPDRSGASYSINLSVPLFDQLVGHRAVSDARLELRQSDVRLKLAEDNVRAEFEQNQKRFELGLRQVGLEERNLGVAVQQAEAASERYKSGLSTALEFRDAQRILLDARSRLAGARQSVKQAELALKRLAGMLVREPSGG